MAGRYVPPYERKRQQYERDARVARAQAQARSARLRSRQQADTAGPLSLGDRLDVVRWAMTSKGQSGDTKMTLRLGETLEAAREASARIWENEDMTTESKQIESRKLRRAAVETVRAKAQLALDIAASRRSGAIKALALAKQDAEAKVDFNRLSAVQREIESRLKLARTWPDVEAIIEAADDSLTLRALQTIGLEVLNQRRHAHGDPLSADPFRIASLPRELEEKAAKYQPVAVALARQAAEEAAADEGALILDMQTLHYSYTLDGYRSPLNGNLLSGIAAEAPTVFRTTDNDGNMHVTVEA